MSFDSSNDSPEKKKASFASLEARCRNVVVMNLERYPPEAMGMLDEAAWESVIKHRHFKTRPHNSTKGGLDGTGRMAPAISPKYITSVEESNPHLAESSCADKLVWKDCVEHRFKRGGMLRPTSLNLPWPDLVESLLTAKADLVGLLKQSHQDENEAMQILVGVIETLTEAPMNVALLQTTGVGKGVKQFLKACSKHKDLCIDVWTERMVKRQSISPEAQLKQVLQKWMTMAKASGISISTSEAASTKDDQQRQDEDGLRIAQQCNSWRELYAALASREMEVRANQGARMREIRKNLDKDRPKIVKVRPTNQKHNRMLEKKSMQPKYAPAAASASKMQQLRAESAIQANWSKSSANSKIAAHPGAAAAMRPSGFGAAVAFASGDKNTKKRKAATISLGGGKHMKVTKKSIKGTGGFAAAVRKNPSTLTSRPKTWRK